MKNIVFLFGAGAEVEYGISGGADFASTVLGINNEISIDIIKNYYNSVINHNNNNKWYPKFKKTNQRVDIKKIISASLRKALHDEEILENINKDNFESIIKYFTKIVAERIKTNNNICIELKQKDLDYIEKESEKLKSIEILLELDNDNARHVIEKYPSYVGILDEKFYSIISPKIYGADSFWFVVSCYTRAYLKIISDIFKKTNSQIDYNEMLNNKKGTIDKVNTEISKITKMNKKTYYTLINDYKERINAKIITTNYTSLVEQATGIDEIAYIHGKISRFEDPYYLKVYESKEINNNNKVLFPYMFLQSAIKPVIELKEIDEYSKMLNYLNNSDIMIIIGFSLNADDNHITSFVRSFLETKEVYYFDYGDDLSYYEENDLKDHKNARENYIKRKLRIKNNNNYHHIFINKKNGYDELKKLLIKLINSK